MGEHATVKVGGYEVPLIGVPVDATQQECSRCGKSVYILLAKLDYHGQPICLWCEHLEIMASMDAHSE